MYENKIIYISAAILMDKKRRLLLVRKKGTSFFMQPGGKIEPGENAREALSRELREELNIEFSKEDFIFSGFFKDLAANEPEHLVHAHIFSTERFVEAVHPGAEIEEILWLSPSEVSLKQLAPLTENKIIPLAWPSK